MGTQRSPLLRTTPKNPAVREGSRRRCCDNILMDMCRGFPIGTRKDAKTSSHIKRIVRMFVSRRQYCKVCRRKGKEVSSMRLNKKALAILTGLTLSAGLGSTAFAASADSFTDVPKDHWAYQALDYLAQEGVIDGMGDSTFQGGRTMTRYEMASIVAKAMQKKDISFGDKAVLDKLSAEYAGELDTLNKKVDANTKAIKDLNAKTDKFKIWGMARVQVGDDNGLQSDYGSKHPGWG